MQYMHCTRISVKIFVLEDRMRLLILPLSWLNMCELQQAYFFIVLQARSLFCRCYWTWGLDRHDQPQLCLLQGQKQMQGEQSLLGGWRASHRWWNRNYPFQGEHSFTFYNSNCKVMKSKLEHVFDVRAEFGCQWTAVLCAHDRKQSLVRHVLLAHKVLPLPVRLPKPMPRYWLNALLVCWRTCR